VETTSSQLLAQTFALTPQNWQLTALTTDRIDD
jgi:hypothetical protein